MAGSDVTLCSAVILLVTTFQLGTTENTNSTPGNDNSFAYINITEIELNEKVSGNQQSEQDSIENTYSTSGTDNSFAYINVTEIELNEKVSGNQQNAGNVWVTIGASLTFGNIVCGLIIFFWRKRRKERKRSHDLNSSPHIKEFQEAQASPAGNIYNQIEDNDYLQPCELHENTNDDDCYLTVVEVHKSKMSTDYLEVCDVDLDNCGEHMYEEISETSPQSKADDTKKIGRHSQGLVVPLNHDYIEVTEDDVPVLRNSHSRIMSDIPDDILDDELFETLETFHKYFTSLSLKRKMLSGYYGRDSTGSPECGKIRKSKVGNIALEEIDGIINLSIENIKSASERRGSKIDIYRKDVTLSSSVLEFSPLEEPLEDDVFERNPFEKTNSDSGEGHVINCKSGTKDTESSVCRGDRYNLPDRNGISEDIEQDLHTFGSETMENTGKELKFVNETTAMLKLNVEDNGDTLSVDDHKTDDHIDSHKYEEREKYDGYVNRTELFENDTRDTLIEKQNNEKETYNSGIKPDISAGSSLKLVTGDGVIEPSIDKDLLRHKAVYAEEEKTEVPRKITYHDLRKSDSIGFELDHARESEESPDIHLDANDSTERDEKLMY